MLNEMLAVGWLVDGFARVDSEVQSVSGQNTGVGKRCRPWIGQPLVLSSPHSLWFVGSTGQLHKTKLLSSSMVHLLSPIPTLPPEVLLSSVPLKALSLRLSRSLSTGAGRRRRHGGHNRRHTPVADAGVGKGARLSSSLRTRV